MKYKNQAVYLELTKKFIKKFSKTRSATKRARLFHDEIDEHVNQFMKSLDYPQVISCKKSCSACCYTEVSVTSDEAKLLYEKIKRGLPVALDRLDEQNRPGEWYKKSYEKRACVFLDDEQSCLVYEDRPSVCRVNFVTSPPSSCETQDGITKPQRLVMIEAAHLLMAAVFLQSEKSGTLSQLVYEEHKREQHVNLKLIP